MPQHVVVLTRGALPGQDPPAPNEIDIGLALERAGVTAEDRAAITAAVTAGTITPHNALLRRIAGQALMIGYARAAKLHEVIAAWVLGSPGDATRFAQVITETVDPAYVVQASDPLGELLNAHENSTGRVIA